VMQPCGPLFRDKKRTHKEPVFRIHKIWIKKEQGSSAQPA
jgi:hypothetical protein